ncbi:cytochrome P450 [Cladochytrium replicatum]|nr:cytochrome P450 [Cladochytrium replicatum]
MADHSLLIAFLIVLLGVITRFFVFGIFLPPLHFPRNLPVVPFWVSTLGFVYRGKLGQDELYRKHILPRMTKKGAVAMWFGGRWNVIVGHPSTARTVFSDAETFKKSGNNEKIPFSVLAYFLGENVISASGNSWKRFRKVLSPALKRAWSTTHFAGTTTEFSETLSKLVDNGKPVVMNELIQRFAMDCIGKAAFSVELEALRNPRNNISVTHSLIKRGIFKPLFLFFPILDRLPLQGRQEIREKIDNLFSLLVQAIWTVDYRVPKVAQSLGISPPEVTSNKCDTDDVGVVGPMLDAISNGEWSLKDLRNNIMITFVAGHENTQQAITSILYLLAKYQDIQQNCYKEVGAVLGNDGKNSANVTPNSRELQDMLYLQKTVKECLRFYPPIPMLVNRLTTKDALVANDIVIPQNTYVGWHAYGIHHHPDVWRDPEVFNPDRFDDKLAVITELSGEAAADRFAWIPFAGGTRQCLGIKLAHTEMLTFLAMTLVEWKWSLVEGHDTTMTPGGLLAPVGLQLNFQKRAET